MTKVKDREDADSHFFLGEISYKRGKLDEAEDYFKKVLIILPKHSEAKDNLSKIYLQKGSVYKQMGDNKKAIHFYKKALSYNPRSTTALNNYGAACLSIGDIKTAMDTFEKIIKIDPNMAQTYYHLGVIFERRGINPRKARVFYEKAYELDPTLTLIPSIVIFLIKHECAWDEQKKKEKILDKLIEDEIKEGKPPSETPFTHIIRCEDPKLNYLVAESKSEQIKQSVSYYSSPYTFSKKKKGKPIRVGYLSCDFHAHPTIYLIQNLISSHNKDKFQTYIYSYDNKKDNPYRKKIKKDCYKFRDITKLGFKEAADIIYSDKIDILVDLKGHTRDSRREICALKPAPIQISYLGFPGTTGADWFDHIITDAIVTPRKVAKYYSEKLAFMPNCYQVNDSKRKIAKTKLKRSFFALPDKGFVFSCFNHVYKIDEDTFTSWMKILKKVPESVLWLLDDNELAKMNIWKKAEDMGVDPHRIIFSKTLKNPMHLKRLTLSDLALDTFICNGHTTTSDALWAGVPVVTKLGNHFASRVSASLLTAIGLPELIANNKKGFEDISIDLANNPNKLENIKKRLNTNKPKSPLFNTKAFTADLERLYLGFWNNYNK